jgi:hypothetical protein
LRNINLPSESKLLAQSGHFALAPLAHREPIMLESIEQVQAAVDPESEMPAAASAMEDETFLSYEISQLWDIHASYQDSIKQEKEKFRAIRGDLGKLLFHMKRCSRNPAGMAGGRRS